MKKEIKISKVKAEAPFYAILGIFAFLSSIFLYGIDPKFVILELAVIAMVLIGLKMSGLRFFNQEYFVSVDEEGIAFKINIFSSKVFVPWRYVNQINYHLHEINFRLVDSLAVASLPLSSVREDEILGLTEAIRFNYEKSLHG